MNKHLTPHQGHISYEERCQQLHQKGLVVWFTGLSGSGKSTIASALERKLFDEGYKVYHLDGDNVRHGLNADLSFVEEDREENIRRVAEVAALFKDAGMITLVSFISPHRKMREYARKVVGEEAYIEVYVKASLEICIQRDVKGLYAKAREGVIEDFTGISAVYEVPERAEIIINTEVSTLIGSVSLLYQKLVGWL